MGRRARVAATAVPGGAAAGAAVHLRLHRAAADAGRAPGEGGRDVGEGGQDVGEGGRDVGEGGQDVGGNGSERIAVTWRGDQPGKVR